MTTLETTQATIEELTVKVSGLKTHIEHLDAEHERLLDL